MIHSITCDKPFFKPIYFKPGFNVIIAERTKDSTKKDSRNGLGKSTLIEIIHFCLGGNKAETLKKAEMNDWTFTMEIDLIGNKYSISRNTSTAGKIRIQGDCSDWPIKPTIDEKTGNKIFSSSDYNKALGVLMFGLQPIYDEYKYHPTFRSLISYFIRRNVQVGAFLNPFQQFKTQTEWDKQVNNAFLLNLGWEYASKWQVLKDRVSVISQIKQEATSGFISNLMGSIGELESLKIRFEAQVKDEKAQLDNFKVHPQYHQLEEDANGLTHTIHENMNQNMNDKRTLEHYEGSLKEEVDAKPEQVTKVYQEAGLIFTDAVKKKIEDVMDFHKQIVVNRKEFLITEMEKLKQNVLNREKDVQEFTSKRSELLQTLKTHGALQEFLALQKNHQATISKLNDISQRLENLNKFEKGKSAVAVDQVLLQQEAKNDLNERKTQKEEAILTFNNYSKELYEASGILSIDISKTGYKYNVEIERSGSHGIGNMKIFCYDLMLTKLWANKTKTTMFLIHDSTIYADVDERQKALALQLASTESAKHGFQYICTLNSDSIPYNDFDKSFNFESGIIRTLTDKTEDGSLLGIRF